MLLLIRSWNGCWLADTVLVALIFRDFPFLGGRGVDVSGTSVMWKRLSSTASPLVLISETDNSGMWIPEFPARLNIRSLNSKNSLFLSDCATSSSRSCCAAMASSFSFSDCRALSAITSLISLSFSCCGVVKCSRPSLGGRYGFSLCWSRCSLFVAAALV